MDTYYEVMIVGGGPAGVVAATQAARLGARTLLLERASLLGGATTSAGINFPGLFHAWGRQVIAGIGWDLVSRCVSESGGTLPDFTIVPPRHWHHQVRVNTAIYTALCDECVVDSGATVMFHAMLGRLVATSDGWRATICLKEGLRDLDVGVVVDCTGDANAAELAGGELRLYDVVHQPGTHSCVASGYDPATLDYSTINANFAAAMARGEVLSTDIGWQTHHPNVANWLRQHGQNANHIPGIAARTSDGRSRINLAGRQAILRVYRFLRQQPGLEHLTIDYLAPECGVRETATVVGDATVTAMDYTSGRVWDDALCYSFYPIDLHTAEHSGLDCRPLATGIVPTIPRGALLARGLRRFAVAGRCASSDRLANSALRVQASAMAMGQAAGAMAALASRDGAKLDLRDLSLTSIREALRAHGAIVPTIP